MNNRTKSMYGGLSLIALLAIVGAAFNGAATGGAGGCAGGADSSDQETATQSSAALFGSPTRTQNCEYGEGTAGPSQVGNYDVCAGEDFWLPDNAEDSAHVGVWHIPVDENGDADYDTDLAPTVRLNWNLSNAALYDESHSTFASKALRRNLYRHSETYCIHLCENVVEWTAGVCALNTTSEYHDSGSVWDLPWYAYSGVCNPAFKQTAEYQKLQRKIMISLGESGIANGTLPASCGLDTFSSAIEAYIDANNTASDATLLKANIQSGILDKADDSPNWYDKTAVKACAKEHIGNVLRAIDGFDMMDQIYAINFTHEGGVLWNWYKLGFNASPGWAGRDAMMESWVEAVSAAVDAYESKASRRASIKAKFYVNFYHGRAFKAQVAEAIDTGMGIGEHSMNTGYAFSYLQHLPHMTYNQSDKRYDISYTNIPPVVHTDIEGLHKAHSDLTLRSELNTWGQYRIYRMAALSEVALGYNSFTNTGSLIPSQGYYQDTYGGEGCDSATGGAIIPTGEGDERRFCNFDYGQIDGTLISGSGALELYSWLRKSAGRRPRAAPEAYCAFHQTGAEIPSGTDFHTEINTNKASEHWGQLHTSPQYSLSYLDFSGKYFHHEVRTDWQFAPKVNHWGRFCKTVQYNAFGQTTQLDGGREMKPSLIGKTDPDLRNKTYTGNFQSDGNYAHEATRLDHTSKTAMIVLDIGDYFVNARSGNWVIKVTLSATPEYCTDQFTYPGTAASGSLNVVYPTKSFSGKALQTLEISHSKTPLCERKDGAYRPSLITITLPLSKSVIDLSKSLATGGGNLQIQQDPGSDVPWDVLLVRVIDPDFKEGPSKVVSILGKGD
jgi:hypothetical protein